MALRTVSAGSLLVVMCALLTAPFIPPSLTPVVAGCALTWMLTAPMVTALSVTSIKLDLRSLFARTRTTYTPWIVVRLAKRMGAPVPRKVQVVTSDRLNAATNGITLFITSAMEPELLTRTGEGAIAHELAHGNFVIQSRKRLCW